MQIHRNQARDILNMMGTVDVSALKTKAARAVLAQLLTTADEGGDAAILKGVPANQPVECIKAIRGLTGLGLKEAKDLLDALDPERRGGDIGPIPLTVPFDQALQDLATSRGKYPSVVSASIVVIPA